MENIFIILLGLSMIYIASTSRLAAHVNMLIFQGWLLFFVCLSGIAKEPSGLESIMASMPHIIGFLFVIIETLIVKALVIPIFLKKPELQRRRLQTGILLEKQWKKSVLWTRMCTDTLQDRAPAIL